jgi:hypothetical protein
MGLESWDWKAQFASLHMRWHSPQPFMALDGEAAYQICVEKLHLDTQLQLWGWRVEPTCFSSDHLQVNGRPARYVPAIAVIVAGVKDQKAVAPPGQEHLKQIPPGGGAIIQALVHGETGEIMIGIGIPVDLQPRH